MQEQQEDIIRQDGIKRVANLITAQVVYTSTTLMLPLLVLVTPFYMIVVHFCQKYEYLEGVPPQMPVTFILGYQDAIIMVMVVLVVGRFLVPHFKNSSDLGKRPERTLLDYSL